MNCSGCRMRVCRIWQPCPQEHMEVPARADSNFVPLPTISCSAAVQVHLFLRVPCQPIPAYTQPQEQPGRAFQYTAALSRLTRPSISPSHPLFDRLGFVPFLFPHRCRNRLFIVLGARVPSWILRHSSSPFSPNALTLTCAAAAQSIRAPQYTPNTRYYIQVYDRDVRPGSTEDRRPWRPMKAYLVPNMAPLGPKFR